MTFRWSLPKQMFYLITFTWQCSTLFADLLEYPNSPIIHHFEENETSSKASLILWLVLRHIIKLDTQRWSLCSPIRAACLAQMFSSFQPYSLDMWPTEYCMCSNIFSADSSFQSLHWDDITDPLFLARGKRCKYKNLHRSKIHIRKRHKYLRAWLSRANIPGSN